MKVKQVYRKLSLIIYYLIAQSLPVSYHFGTLGKLSKLIRAKLCTQIFASCGKNVNIERGVLFGDGVGVQIGDHSGIGINCQIPNSIIIGRYVMIGSDVMAIAQNHEFSDVNIPMTLQGYKPSLPIVVDDDVWIGARVIILPGVHIGKGSIVGAGAVVTSDVAPYSICAGNPAKVIRNRIIK